ncbi:XtrA/YqaO family protein [Bacillus sp. B-jedd]|uniref:XtrA/YqaO family protein n=1 Tax=Bacillus sp. B-jedd TaxID=1476857 RepID=UPI0005156ECC|nr:XtrA/YqaO family protein [Bacillus sp. B-jedd]CEG25978.1 phage-like protein [Bacillus sp. B-jedd]
MHKRLVEIEIDDKDLSVKQHMEPGKVLVLVLDGQKGKAYRCEAVKHGLTIVETTGGKSKRVTFEESELC